MEGQGTFVNNGDNMEFVVRVKGHNYRWLWLLLLLLPLLLLLSFSKDVTFEASDNKSNEKLKDVNIGFDYVDYALIKTNPLRFFVADTVKLTGKTDTDGKLTFTNVKYTLYSVVFHSGKESEVRASAGCLVSDTLHPFFSQLQDVIPYRISLGKTLLDIVFKVLDENDNQPVAGAEVEAEVEGNVIKLLTDPAGYVTIPGIPYCGNVDVNAQMDGYSGDTIKCDVATALQGEHNRTLLIKPGIGVVSFVVQDLENQLPIPNVEAQLIAGDSVKTATTNTNGIGKGCFDNLSSIMQFHIDLHKISYNDTSSKVYKVVEFERLKESDRVFKMRQQKNALIFRNIDSLTNKPLDGVKNEIFINGSAVGEAYSNNQGCFTVGNIADNDVVMIKSSHPSYKFKNVKRKGADFGGNNQYKRDILLLPNIKVGKPDPRRNCGVHFSGTLLSDTKVQGHISKIYEPDQYGEYVGDGRYLSNQIAFPKAVQYTFDAIAVDKGTHLKVYSKPNFQGEVLLDVSGPYLINNVKWKNDSRISDFQTRTFSPQFEANYPKSCRHWSNSNMNSWDFGSVIITCD